MSGTNTTTDKNEQANNLKMSLNLLAESTVFENLDLFMVDSFNTWKANQTPYGDKELLDKVSKEIKASKLNFFDDIKGMANTLMQVLYTMGNIKDSKELELYVSQVYNSLSGNIVQIGQKITQESRLNFKDYFHELQVLQTTLKDVKSIADEMSKTNRGLGSELSHTKTQSNNYKINLERKTKRCDKLKKTIEEYKNNTLKLVCTVEMELERLKMVAFEDLPEHLNNIKLELNRQSDVGQELYQDVEGSPTRRGGDSTGVSRPQSRLASPTRGGDMDGVWFDIEKSQERYEALLDSYQKIINDKDNYMKNLEGDLSRSQLQKLSAEDDFQRAIKGKETQIQDLDIKVNEVLFENTRLKADLALKPIPEVIVSEKLIYVEKDGATRREGELENSLQDGEIKLRVAQETENNLKIKNEE